MFKTKQNCDDWPFDDNVTHELKIKTQPIGVINSFLNQETSPNILQVW